MGRNCGRRHRRGDGDGRLASRFARTGRDGAYHHRTRQRDANPSADSLASAHHHSCNSCRRFTCRSSLARAQPSRYADANRCVSSTPRLVALRGPHGRHTHFHRSGIWDKRLCAHSGQLPGEHRDCAGANALHPACSHARPHCNAYPLRSPAHVGDLSRPAWRHALRPGLALWHVGLRAGPGQLYDRLCLASRTATLRS